MSKADELAVSLAAHQEWHLKQAGELQQCHSQIQRLEEEAIKANNQVKI